MPGANEERKARRLLGAASGPVRLTVGEARRRYPQVGAALDAADGRAFLAGLDAPGLTALLAELQALGPARLERDPMDGRR